MLVPLKGKKILITREENQARLFSEIISREGGIPIEIPLLKVLCTVCEQNKQFLSNLSIYKWTFFTSANGVDCFLKQCNEGDLFDLLKTSKIAAVGSKTALSLQKHGYKVDFIPTTYNAEVMASEFLRNTSTDGPILLVRGNRSREVLPIHFLKHGIDFDLMEVYKTTFNYGMKFKLNEILMQTDFDYFTFTSPSTVDAFIEMIDKDSIKDKALEVNCVCIGTTTEKRAKEVGFKSTHIPEEFTIEGMVKCIKDQIVKEG